MSVGYLVTGLVLAFAVLDVLVLVYLFRRSARRAAALRVPSQRIPMGRPRRGAFDVDDALTWTASVAGSSFSSDEQSLTWDDELDGYTDLSGSRNAGGDTFAPVGDGTGYGSESISFGSDASRPSDSSSGSSAPNSPSGGW
jgi:hypothetical protein